MSAIPLEDAIERASSPERSSKLPPKALAYFLIVAAGAVAVTAPFLADFESHTGDWLEFVLLATSVAVAQFFVVRTPGNKSYHTTGVFLIAAALLVSPALLALIPLIQHIPEWLRSRGTWYVQMTNIFVFTIATMSAWGAAHVISGADGLIASDDVRFALAGTAAAIVLVVLNSALIAPMIRLVNGHPMRQLFSYQTLSTEFVFAALGVILAAFWTGNPWLVPFAIAPLLLIHRALSVPQLQAEARVDPKTGLFNARYFASALSEELGRAERFERPLSLIMADLDLLREINNTYGHLAGDAVLKGIAEVFRAELRHYDVPARFGGEEFSILLPETPPEQAMEIAERIRRAVAESAFDVETSSEPIRATVSIGVAGYPKDAQDPNALIHQADLAVYRAKLQGRNRVLGASSEPLLMPADRTQRLVAVPEEGDHREPLARVPEALPEQERRHTAHTTSGPRFLQLSLRLGVLVGLVSSAGIAAGIVGAIFGSSTDMIGLLAVIALVSVGEALALELDDGSISVSAVGALAGAALFGPRAALVLAVAICVVQWSAQRQQIHRVLFNIGTLTLSSLAATCVFMLGFDGALGELVTVASRHRRRRPLLRRQHRPALRRPRRRGARERLARLARALPLARASLPRLRLHRRSDRDRLPRCGALRPRGLRGTAAADAQDAGGVPVAHAPERAEAAPGRRDDPHPKCLARAGEPAAERALDGGDGEPLGHGRRTRCLHGRSLAPGAAACTRDRPRARPLADRARSARPRSPLP